MSWSFWMFGGMEVEQTFWKRLYDMIIFYLMSWISFYIFNYVINDEQFIVSLYNNSEWKLDRVKVNKIELNICNNFRGKVGQYLFLNKKNYKWY